MKLRGQDVEDGLRDWIKGELKDAPSQKYDLGKFFFTVSIGSIGVLVAIEKLSSSSQIDLPLIVSFVFLFAAIIFSLSMALPEKPKTIGGLTDLLDLYTREIESIRNDSLSWFSLWITGIIFGGFAIL
ncbi:MAG: hypothetical protein H8D96_18195 [Desulfobacterales bacterium]|uniref:Uncharacterized protein n=1 Tax=Candidatus Desulfatibia vada TaxID=2841696 RepID=A0A8J6NTU1_9BACT|nr:hypothetical protein [Candidatus Desulfatibia vada]